MISAKKITQNKHSIICIFSILGIFCFVQKYAHAHAHICFSSGCPELFWGEDCVRKCPDKCKGCNNINGLCEFGCVLGWKGYHCSEGIIEDFC